MLAAPHHAAANKLSASEALAILLSTSSSDSLTSDKDIIMFPGLRLPAGAAFTGSLVRRF